MLDVYRWRFSAWRTGRPEAERTCGTPKVVDVDAIARWWDGVELWITGLPFVPQALVVILVAVPAAFGLARVFDRVLAAVLHVLGRDARSDSDTVPVPGPSITEGH